MFQILECIGAVKHPSVFFELIVIFLSKEQLSACMRDHRKVQNSRKHILYHG